LTAVRGTAIAFWTVVVLVTLAVQCVADGLYGSVAVAPSVPRALAGDWPFELMARTGLDRIPAVRRELARGALVKNEPGRATALLAPLAASAEVVDLRGRAALLANDPATALRDFAISGDFVAAESAIDALGTSDPRAALTIVRDFAQRLAAGGAAPEIGAEVEWREGVIAAQAAAKYPADAATYDHDSLDAFARALERAPNEEKYLLNYAFAALRIGDAEGALKTYQRAAQVVPDSVDAFAGIAVTAATLGDCGTARTALGRAEALAGEQHRVLSVAADGYAADVRDALAHCNP
jgi:tetratricopeptide (TPR) repeat protein